MAVFVEPIRVIITSRGCPYKCIFCSIQVHMGHAFRWHSAEYIVLVLPDPVGPISSTLDLSSSTRLSSSSLWASRL